MNRNQRRMAAFNAKKAAEKIGQQRFERKLTQAMTGCSDRVLKAVTHAPNWRVKAEKEVEFVSRENPEYRKVKSPYGQITNARQKMRGRSIPLV